MGASPARLFFVSDVHVRPTASCDRLERFRLFTEQKLRRGDELYLLGDVFDFWIGPSHLQLPDYRSVIELLRRLKSRSVTTFFVSGNRDYLVEECFAETAGVTLLGKEHILSLSGRQVLLTHGDRIYNKNLKYTLYRAFVDFPPVRKAILHLPSAMMRNIAVSYRNVSQREKRFMAASPPSIEKDTAGIFARGIDVLICGHIHQPSHVRTEHRGKPCEIIVLGDWSDGCEYAVYEDEHLTLYSFKGASVQV